MFNNVTNIRNVASFLLILFLTPLFIIQISQILINDKTLILSQVFAGIHLFIHLLSTCDVSDKTQFLLLWNFLSLFPLDTKTHAYKSYPQFCQNCRLFNMLEICVVVTVAQLLSHGQFLVTS